MTALVPNRFLFDFEFPLHYRAAPPVVDGDVEDWDVADRLPKLGAIDGRSDFADVFACWNEDGIWVAFRVRGKRRPLRCDPASFRTGDNLRLCLSTRETLDIRRATRFCHHFYFLPIGGGDNGRAPLAGLSKFQAAKEAPPKIPVERIRAASRISTDGYSFESHLPAECLYGFDPAEHPRIGFYYLVEDADLGQQYLTVGDDLAWYADPSTWATALLRR
jgi:hypothetical protein